MLNKILHTLGSRLIMGLFNLALLFITTRWMGAEVKGSISLLVLNLSVLALVSGLFGGPALVYLVPRYALRQIITLSYVWSTLATAGFTLFVMTSGMGETVESWRFFRMGLMESLIGTNLMILLGSERVQWHNILQVIKVALTVSLLTLFIQRESSDFIQFVNAYEVSLAATVLLSTLGLFGIKSTTDPVSGNIVDTIRACFKFGGLVQAGNIAQILNYRLSYYFLELLISPPELALIRIGIYSAAVQVSEALWQFAKSISTVQYSVVSNMKDHIQALQLSMKLVRLNYAATTIGVLVLLAIPASGYTQLLGNDFAGIKAHIVLLSPGIIALAFSNAFSHFFAGVGDHRFNTITSIGGLVLTVCIAYPSIYYFSTEGAALAASIVYILQTMMQFYFLNQRENVTLNQLALRKSDFSDIASRIKGLIANKS